MLYIVSTPIGNLEDFSHRAKKTLEFSDYILCEDTRISKRLLEYYNIKKKLISFHKFSEKAKENQIIEDLEKGKDICLISDSGTPLICDPGYSLVNKCIEKNISYTAIPGACSVIAALVMSGFSAPFQFIGFLPKKPGELKALLNSMLLYKGVSICFESTNRIHKTLKEIAKVDKKRKIVYSKRADQKI